MFFSTTRYKFWCITTTFNLFLFFSGIHAIDYGLKRENCKGSDIDARLEAIRQEMQVIDYDELEGFIVTPHDSNQNSIVPPRDQRLKYLTGFTGYFGDALVTRDKAVFWTDDTYIKQAKSELSCEWIILNKSDLNSATLAQWLINEYKEREYVHIGADPTLVPAYIWHAWKKELQNTKIRLIRIGDGFDLTGGKNLIDNIWAETRPKYRDWEAKYNSATGKSWIDKVTEVREQMRKVKADALVLTDLSEIAWLFNFHGYGLPGIYVSQAYAVIEDHRMRLFVDQNKLSKSLKNELRTEKCYNSNCVKLVNYDQIYSELRTYSQLWKKVWLPSHCHYSPGVSLLVERSINPKRTLINPSPIIGLRATKNLLEIKGIRNAHRKDAKGAVRELAYLEKKFDDKERWSITQVWTNLKSFFYELDDAESVPLPISIQYGTDFILPCYNDQCNKTQIGDKLPIVIHAAKTYKDGTAAYARTTQLTKHPNSEHRKAYTRALIRLIDAATTTFPTDSTIDKLQQIFKNSVRIVDYDDVHSSPHAFSHFLSIDSNLIGSPSERSTDAADFKCKSRRLNTGQFIIIGTSERAEKPNTEEQYQIKLESTMAIVSAEQGSHLRLEDISRIPYDSNLIDSGSLSQKHKNWLNEHNYKIRKEILKMSIKTWPLTADFLPEIYLLERTRKL